MSIDDVFNTILNYYVMFDNNLIPTVEIVTGEQLYTANRILNKKDIKSLRIAIDGEAATGKTTVAEELAQKLNLSFLKTGELYRILTLFLLKKNLTVLSEKKISKYLKDLKFEIKGDIVEANFKYSKNDLLDENVAKNVSFVASLKTVRKFLLKIQKDFANRPRVILEGRDIGTVIMPNADFKFYLTVRPDVAALRRFRQIAVNNTLENSEEFYNKIKHNILERNEIDRKRLINPLKKAGDAFVIDTSYYSVDEVVNQILDIIFQGGIKNG